MGTYHTTMPNASSAQQGVTSQVTSCWYAPTSHMASALPLHPAIACAVTSRWEDVWRCYQSLRVLGIPVDASTYDVLWRAALQVCCSALASGGDEWPAWRLRVQIGTEHVLQWVQCFRGVRSTA